MAPLFLQELERLIRQCKIGPESKILFCDDGSTDNTWDVIRHLASTSSKFKGIRLSRNFGHQNALAAGLNEARQLCDVAITIDCDGQDDLRAMETMVDAYRKGFDIVYGVRSDRGSDSRFKRITAEGFYRFMKFMGVETVFNHADYRLMSVRTLDRLAEFKEQGLYLRGLVPLIGYPSTSVSYVREEHTTGKSHYNLCKMLAALPVFPRGHCIL